MDDQLDVKLLQDILDSTSRALRFQIGLAISLVLVGLIAGIVGNFSGLLPENQRWIAAIGGLFPPSLSAFPVNKIFERIDRKKVLKYLIIKLQSGKEEEKKAARKQVENLTAKWA